VHKVQAGAGGAQGAKWRPDCRCGRIFPEDRACTSKRSRAPAKATRHRAPSAPPCTLCTFVHPDPPANSHWGPTLHQSAIGNLKSAMRKVGWPSRRSPEVSGGWRRGWDSGRVATRVARWPKGARPSRQDRAERGIGGEGGIRTHVPLLATRRFRGAPVTTTSVPLRIRTDAAECRMWNGECRMTSFS
jgi:hypothetical protein